jgi:hypothetical protein
MSKVIFVRREILKPETQGGPKPSDNEGPVLQ